MRASLLILVVGVIAVLILVAFLKVAVQLALIGVVIVVALALWAAVKERMGGPRG